MYTNLIKEIVKQLEQVLQKKVSVEPARKGQATDYTVRIEDNIYYVAEKNQITNSNYGTILQSIQVDATNYTTSFILIARHITTTLMDDLFSKNINCIDGSGNMRLKFKDFLIHIEGKKELSTTNTNYKSRLFQEAGLKLIFQLLLEPTLINQPYRVINERAGISLGSVKIIIDELINSNYIIPSARKRLLINTDELLNKWIEGYTDIIKPKHLKTTLCFRSFELESKWQEVILPTDSFWSGEPGAHLLNGYLMPELFSIYTSQPTSAFIKKGFRQSEDGNVFIYENFWPDTPNTNMKRAKVLLIYADLMGSGISRNIEAANKIFSHELNDR